MAATIYILKQEEKQLIMFNSVEVLINLATNQLQTLKWLENKIPSE